MLLWHIFSKMTKHKHLNIQVMHHSGGKKKDELVTQNQKAETLIIIMTAPHVHVHILFGSLNVSLDLRCNVKT